MLILEYINKDGDVLGYKEPLKTKEGFLIVPERVANLQNISLHAAAVYLHSLAQVGSEDFGHEYLKSYFVGNKHMGYRALLAAIKELDSSGLLLKERALGSRSYNWQIFIDERRKSDLL